MKRQLKSNLNDIRKMLPGQIYLETIPFGNKKYYYQYSNLNFTIYKNGPISEIRPTNGGCRLNLKNKDETCGHDIKIR